jgi:phosphate transport system substrate-binding protein
MRHLLIKILMVAAAVSPARLAAEEARAVTLRMKGGSFQVNGEIRSFDGNRYIVETTEFGRMTLQAARFECVGAGCTAMPPERSWTQEALSADRHEAIAVSGSDLAVNHVLPALVRGYAAASGLTVVNVIGTKPGTLRFRLSDRRGRDVATIDLAEDAPARSIDALERGEHSLSVSDRAATREQLDALAAAGSKARIGSNETTIGVDGLAVVVSPDHPAASLPVDVVARIFSGQITDWYEAGLPQGKIRILLRDDAGEAVDRMTAVLLKPRGLKLAAEIERLPRESDIADAVARDRHAIGLVSLAAVRNARALNLETPCGLVQRPTIFAVRAGEYPLARRLYMHAIAPPRQAIARELLRFAASPEGQATLAELPVATLATEALPFAEQAERIAFALNAQGEAFDLSQMKGLLADLKGARRISTTFRFAPGTVDLDQPSKVEVARLAALLMSAEYAGRRILLAGFTDQNGAKFQSNLTASYKRAGQVRAALLAASGQKLDHRLTVAEGYGPLAPVACGDTADGTRLNRRVEVWIRD